jgi:hypothetical protein
VRWKTGLGREITGIIVLNRVVFAATGDGIAVLGADSGTVTAESARGFRAAGIAVGGSVVAARTATGELRFFDAVTLAEKPARDTGTASAGPVLAGTAFLYASGKAIKAVDPGKPASETVADLGFPASFLGAAADVPFGVSDNLVFSLAGGKVSTLALGRSVLAGAMPDGAGGLVAVSRAGRVFAKSPGDAGTGEAASAFESLFMPSGGIKERIAEKAVKYSGTRDGAPFEASYDVWAGQVPVALTDGYTVFAFQASESKTFAIEVTPTVPEARSAKRSCPAFAVVFDDQGEEIGSNVDELGVAEGFDHPFELGRTYWIAVGPSYEAAKGKTVLLRLR